MTHQFKSPLAAAVLILAMLACSLSGTDQPLTVDEQAATIIAATLSAQPFNGTDDTVSATPSLTPTALAGTTPTRVSAATITPTFSTPMLTVLESTNCREGPGEEYRIVFTHLADVDLEIVGRYDPNNFWLVNSPQSPTGTCWLWGEYVELSGSYWVVPTVTPPSTATTAPPGTPSIESWEFSCSGGNLTFNLIWEDRATNESGYRIFRDGEAVVELPPNSSSFTETIPVDGNEDIEYYLQVYGPSGTANTSIIRLSCRG
jgi:hypothetical protein